MQGFFFELCNIFNNHAPAVTASVKSKSRKEYIFERFYETLVESYQSERSVKFYADQLCLTPKHLSGVVKEVSGKTVGEWIDEFVILEAKALLNSSSMNIQEIADRLSFANQSFFGKYFKHYTGMSPKESIMCLQNSGAYAAQGLRCHQQVRGYVCQRSAFDDFRMCLEQEIIAFAGGFKAPGVSFDLRYN